MSSQNDIPKCERCGVELTQISHFWIDARVSSLSTTPNGKARRKPVIEAGISVCGDCARPFTALLTHKNWEIDRDVNATEK